MKKVLLFFLSLLPLFANEYYSKVEPKNIYHIKSDVSGQVVFSDDTMEGKYANSSLIVKIDDKIDLADLKSTKTEYENTKKLIEIAKKTYQIDLSAYNKIKDLKTYSKTQKDAKLLKMLSSKTTLLTYQTNLAKLKLKLETLKDKISKKNIKISDKYYVLKVYPKKWDYVSMGSPLVDIADLSKAKLTIFVTNDDLLKIKNRDILIDGKKQKYKIVKILKVADTVNLSGYKVELEIAPPKIFSKLIKVEIK